MIKAVILAAGMARRLQPLTNSTPKCLLPIGGKTLLSRMLDTLWHAGIHHLVMVTGFEAEQIRNHVAVHHPDFDCEFIHNELYDQTNNAYSLWLTRRAIEGDQLLLMDSDILFHPAIISTLISQKPSCLALRNTGKLGDEEIKVKPDKDGYVFKISKTILPEEAIGESLGIEFFSESDTTRLFDITDSFIRIGQRVNDFYEAAFEEAIATGMKIKPVPIGNLPCMEIDTAADLELAIQLARQLDNIPSFS